MKSLTGFQRLKPRNENDRKEKFEFGDEAVLATSLPNFCVSKNQASEILRRRGP